MFLFISFPENTWIALFSFHFEWWFECWCGEHLQKKKKPKSTSSSWNIINPSVVWQLVTVWQSVISLWTRWEVCIRTFTVSVKYFHCTVVRREECREDRETEMEKSGREMEKLHTAWEWQFIVCVCLLVCLCPEGVCLEWLCGHTTLLTFCTLCYCHTHHLPSLKMHLLFQW